MNVYYIKNPESIPAAVDAAYLSTIKPVKTLSVKASRYRYQVVRLWVYTEYGLKGALIDITPLKSETDVLDKSACTCLNTQGCGADGVRIDKAYDIKPSCLQPVVLGMDLSQAKLQKYTTVLNIGPCKVNINVDVKDTPVFNDCADGNSFAGRLKWLNSRLMRDKSVAKGFEPVVLDGAEMRFTGKTVKFATNGLFENANSYFDLSNNITEEVQKTLFFRPMEFIVEGQKFKYARPRLETLENVAAIYAEGKSEAFQIVTSAVIGYEGAFDYTVKLKANKDAIVPSVNLNMYFASHSLNAGLGLEGGAFRPVEWKFNPAVNQDSMYIGDVNCGACVKLKANNYSRPLSGKNYALKPLVLPEDSWANYGAGTVSVYDSDEGAVFSANAGKFVVPKGAELTFRFEIRLTPFRPIRIKRQFAIRPYQPTFQSEGLLDDASERVCNYVNLISGGDFSPYTNNPFMNEKALKLFVSDAHNANIGVNLQYAPSPVSAHASDVDILRRLGDDVLIKTEDGRELAARKGFRGALHDGENPDVVFAATPDGRMDNYFVEGVNYLVKECGIDGIYLSDGNICRDTVERVRRIFDRKTGLAGIIDLGIVNDFKGERGLSSALNNCTEILPFVDKVYARKGFDFSRERDYLLTEVSGLPYGVTAEAVAGVNPVLAILFGMTVRYSAIKETKDEDTCFELHRVLDEFGIGDAIMKGFWDDTNPMTADKKDVSITTYINDGKMLAAIYNFGDTKVEFDIGVNPRKGFTSTGKKFVLPSIKGLQKKKKYNLNSSLSLGKRSGMIIIIK